MGEKPVRIGMSSSLSPIYEPSNSQRLQFSSSLESSLEDFSSENKICFGQVFDSDRKVEKGFGSPSRNQNNSSGANTHCEEDIFLSPVSASGEAVFATPEKLPFDKFDIDFNPVFDQRPDCVEHMDQTAHQNQILNSAQDQSVAKVESLTNTISTMQSSAKTVLSAKSLPPANLSQESILSQSQNTNMSSPGLSNDVSNLKLSSNIGHGGSMDSNPLSSTPLRPANLPTITPNSRASDCMITSMRRCPSFEVPVVSGGSMGASGGYEKIYEFIRQINTKF